MVNLKKLLTKIMKQTPIGTIQMYGGTTAPEGWLLCNGAIKNISEYPALAAVLGTNYGGNGTTTFGLPDMSGRMPIGVSSAHPISGTGSYGGSENAVVVTHTHTTTTDGATTTENKTGLKTKDGGDGGGGAVSNVTLTGFFNMRRGVNGTNAITSASGIMSHGHSSNSINSISSAGGSSNTSEQLSINASHAGHTIPNHQHSVQDHNHTIAQHSHTAQVPDGAVSGTGMNMPPYRTVNFIIYAGI